MNVIPNVTDNGGGKWSNETIKWFRHIHNIESSVCVCGYRRTLTISLVAIPPLVGLFCCSNGTLKVNANYRHTISISSRLSIVVDNVDDDVDKMNLNCRTLKRH